MSVKSFHIVVAKLHVYPNGEFDMICHWRHTDRAGSFTLQRGFFLNDFVSRLENAGFDLYESDLDIQRQFFELLLFNLSNWTDVRALRIVSA